MSSLSVNSYLYPVKTLNIKPLKEAFVLLLFLFSLSFFSNRIARHSIHNNDKVTPASFLKEAKAIVIAQSFVKNTVSCLVYKNKVTGFITPFLKIHLENKQRSTYIISFIKNYAYITPPSSTAFYYHLFSLKDDDFLF